MTCKYCGGDDDGRPLLHAATCDGQQGRVDAVPAVPIVMVRVPGGKGSRETSVQAFYNAVDTGLIKTRHEQVYAALRALGVATSNEVFERMKQDYAGPRYISTVAARFTELRDMGVIREAGERLCRVTKQLCLTWEVVPLSEYVGPAVIHRCPTCHQIVSREMPVVVPA